MTIIGFVKAKLGYVKNVNEYKSNRIRKGECIEKDGKIICNRDNRIEKRRL